MCKFVIRTRTLDMGGGVISTEYFNRLTSQENQTSHVACCIQRLWCTLVGLITLPPCMFYPDFHLHPLKVTYGIVVIVSLFELVTRGRGYSRFFYVMDTGFMLFTDT
jgi:hypothetical protein